MRITGSRAAAVLGLSPWSKPGDVLREMVRQAHGAEAEFKGNICTEHGTKNEARAILCFMRKTGINVEPCGFFPHGEFLGASPDGLTDDGGIVEIKVPYSLKNGDKPFQSLNDQQYYLAQVQMEMMATGRKHAYFAQYIAPNGDPFADDYVAEQMQVERVELDEAWEALNMPAFQAFFELLKSELSNKKHLEPLRETIDTKLAEIVLRMIDAAKEAENENKKNRAELLEILVEMANGKNALIHGRKLTKSEGGPSVSYSAAIKELLPKADMSKWTTQSADSWLLSKKSK